MAERLTAAQAQQSAARLDMNALLSLADQTAQQFYLRAPVTPGESEEGVYINPDGTRNDIYRTNYIWLYPTSADAAAGRARAVKVSRDEATARVIRAAAIMYAESGGDPLAVCYNITKPDGSKGCSKVPPDDGRGYDRGVWQWNSKAWPTITDVVAYDPVRATRIAYDVSKGFTQWQPWSKSRGMLGLGTDDKGQPTPLQLAYDANVSRTGYAIDKGLFGLPGEAAFYNSIGSMLDAAKQALAILASAAAWVAEPSNWLRILEVLGGAALVVLGATMVAKDLTPLGALTKVAGKVAG